MDTLHIPALIRESAPGRATRMQLRSATRLSQGAALATAAEHCAEAFSAADNLLRALRDIQALPTNRKQEMRDWLADTAGRALDQLSNVEGCIERELDAQGCDLAEPLDLSELRSFWESVK
jgi:predicted membrane chloride channel (bestrophin family)